MSTGSKVYIETYGCSASFSDSEICAGQLSQAGYLIVDNPKDSDVNVIVTCTVKTATANRMFHRIKKLSENNSALVVAGCMPKTQAKEIKKLNPNASLMGPDSIDQITDIVNSTLNGTPLIQLGKSTKPKVLLPKIRINPVIDIVEIGTGCLSSCTFCQVKIAKGTLISYPPNAIVEQIQKSTDSSCREIWLTSTDNGCYGMDMSMDLADLLTSIVDIQNNFLVRVGMMNPMHTKKKFHKLLNIFSHDKIYKFLHIPVQSGNNRVLKSMLRGHSREDYILMCSSFREKFPLSSIATDIIVGYPTESDEEFRDTVELIKSTQPDVVNLSKYGARPGTKAIEMEQVPNSIINARSKSLTSIIKEISLERNKKWLDWTGN
ncbi:MAG TPA: tRNA (N(6)-L-threonylcarbamoyladenosine(37)-C(2))-methylthiotransferase, partial [Nitrososphaerales archaeon]|nr:tRNA (N(6)-L-threonylcarbamoyladenosine(37)-C(2))-methylthiotransferase [Nitrososphaerales archaeon]